MLEIAPVQSIFMPRDQIVSDGFLRFDVPEVSESHIRKQLGSEVIGQDDAVDRVAGGIMRCESGMNDPDRPKGVFLFLGPTGVGKTELARGMARLLYGPDWKNRFLKIDCTDYTDSVSVNKIKGSQHGYVGYGDPVLIMPEFLKKGGVVVFDEIEKAHGSLHNWLLPVMEDGEVKVPLASDRPAANGAKNGKEIEMQTLDFRNTYIVMTANVGAEAMKSAKKGNGPIGFNNGSSSQHADVSAAGMHALKRHFSHKPEFLGRIGESNTIPFRDLEEDHYLEIFDKFLGLVNANQRQNPVLLTTTYEMREWLVARTMEGDYGARTLRDLIDTRIVDEAAKLRYATIIKGGLLIADIDPETGKTHFWAQNATSARASKNDSKSLVAISEPHAHVAYAEI